MTSLTTDNTESTDSNRNLRQEPQKSDFAKPRLMLISTVPDTFTSVLRDQPHFLNSFFEVSIVCGPPETIDTAYDTGELVAHEILIKRAPSPFADIASIVKLIKVIKQRKPDIVHSFSPKAGLVTMCAASFCRVPVRIHTFTGLIFPSSKGFRKVILKNVDRLIAALATNVVPEGLGVRDDLYKANITKKEMKLIGNGNIAGVDLSYFDPLNPELTHSASVVRKQWGIPEGSFIFGFVGRLSKDKGIDELVQAFTSLSSDNAWLLCLGYTDSRLPVRPETIKIMKEHPRVILAGFTKDIRASVMNMSVMVLPSYREGFPNVLLQAGAMRIPVIATDISGCNEIVDPGKTGWLIPIKDVTALKTAMNSAMNKADELRKLGKNSRLRIEKYFGQTYYREALVSYYRIALEQQKK